VLPYGLKIINPCEVYKNEPSKKALAKKMKVSKEMQIGDNGSGNGLQF
jgi:hypothetical protein